MPHFETLSTTSGSSPLPSTSSASSTGHSTTSPTPSDASAESSLYAFDDNNEFWRTAETHSIAAAANTRTTSSDAHSGIGGADNANTSSSDDTINMDACRLSQAEVGAHYRLVRYLGSGSYGHVHLAEDVRSGQRVAIKKTMNIFDNLTNAKRLLREIKILRMFRHQNVIDFIQLLPPTDPANFSHLLIVFSFVDTDLQKLIHSDQTFSNDHVQYFLYQLLCGVKYIHSAGVIHRDLKPANVLVMSNCALKICDFGLARARTEGETEVDPSSRKRPRDTNIPPPPPPAQSSSSIASVSRVGLKAPSRLTRELTKHVVTRWYRAPELILLNDRYTTAIDMWSVGCILAELLSMQTHSFTHRQPLFPGRTCFPFSAENPLAYTDHLDQLNVIFDVLGTPDPADIALIENEKARNYLLTLPKRASTQLERKFPGADERALDLLKRLLCFDPSKRLTADAALTHPYLQDIRDESEESVYSGGPVEWSFEDAPVSKENIKHLIIEEILKDNGELNVAAFMPAPSTTTLAGNKRAARRAVAKDADTAARAAVIDVTTPVAVASDETNNSAAPLDTSDDVADSHTRTKRVRLVAPQPAVVPAPLAAPSSSSSSSSELTLSEW